MQGDSEKLIKVSCDFGLQIKNLLIHPVADYDVHMVSVDWATLGNTIGPQQHGLCQKFDLVFCGGAGCCSSWLWIIDGIFSSGPGSCSGKHRPRGSWEAAWERASTLLWHQEVKSNTISIHCWWARVPWMPSSLCHLMLRNCHASCNIKVFVGLLVCALLWMLAQESGKIINVFYNKKDQKGRRYIDLATDN